MALLLHGRAYGQVFDGERVIEGCCAGSSSGMGGMGHQPPGGGEKGGGDVALKGTPRRSDVGFLTLFEAYGHVEAGSFLKRPLAPVWVVCSESHYSVLFSLEARRCTAAGEGGGGGSGSGSGAGRFDLFYYDGLAGQDEEVRLTVDCDPGVEPPSVDDDSALVPPLDLVIRTKWCGAAVDWNDSEPIL